MRIKNLLLIMVAFLFVCNTAEASFMDALNVINSTANTVNSVNRAGRGTMSTVEYAQRFQDRQQDRKDYKRSQKEYNQNAEAEYYKIKQESEALKYQMYNTGSNL